jgi:hypothetical protein
MSTLQGFLAEIRADPKIGAALATGKATNEMTAVEAFFAVLEDHSHVGIELHDKIARIIQQGTPLKHRLSAVFDVMNAELPSIFDSLDPKWREKYSWRPKQELQ